MSKKKVLSSTGKMMRCSLSEDIPTPRDLRLIFSVESSTMQTQPESTSLTKSNGILHIQNFWQPDLHTKLQRKKTCRNFCTWKNFWKHPEFLWNREKLPEKWVPVSQKPLKSWGFLSVKPGFSENIWMQEREKQ